MGSVLDKDGQVTPAVIVFLARCNILVGSIFVCLLNGRASTTTFRLRPTWYHDRKMYSRPRNGDRFLLMIWWVVGILPWPFIMKYFIGKCLRGAVKRCFGVDGKGFSSDHMPELDEETRVSTKRRIADEETAQERELSRMDRFLGNMKRRLGGYKSNHEKNGQVSGQAPPKSSKGLPPHSSRPPAKSSTAPPKSPKGLPPHSSRPPAKSSTAPPKSPKTMEEARGDEAAETAA